MVKPFKLGIVVYNQEQIDQKIKAILKKYSKKKKDSCVVKEKKVIINGKTSKRD